jgi:CRP/FNR family cyclic AMP-dependent transcriptional regulator
MKLGDQRFESALAMLSKTPLWSGLDDQDYGWILRLSEERAYDAGDEIVKEGNAGTGFHLIMDGAVEVRSNGTSITKLGPGQYFGEMSILDDEPASADVVALENSKCLVLSAAAFKTLVTQNRAVTLKIFREFARRLRATNKSLT